MTELLSREKEFIKLNERLDKLATVNGSSSVVPSQQQAAAAQTTGKGETKYLTYTKSKGPGNVGLKKRGAGDGDDVLVSSYKSTNGSSFGRSARGGTVSTNKHIPHATGTSSTVGGSATPFTTAEETLTTTTNASNNGTQQRKHTKLPTSDAASRTFSHISSQRLPPTSTGTFTVKYRNPKFVESPSLEVLVKDESATIRSKLSTPADGSHHGTDVDSVTSHTESGNKRLQGNGRKHFSTDGLIKFLKSKIVILEEDHDRISLEMTQQKELLEKTLERQKKVELQRDQAYAKHNALTEQLTKVEAQLEETNRRVKERVVEQSSQQKELEIVRREIKQLTQTNTSLEKRLYRANEELESTKNALGVMKNAERELRETMRAESESKDKQIKSLKKQRADLLNAYKKQLFLIDNLKRQNVCMEQSKMIGFSEKEFTKVLEWNTKT